MRRHVRKYVVALAAVSLAAMAGQALAGKLEFDFSAAEFTDPTNVDNDYWPLSALGSAVYRSESDDGCEVNQMVVSRRTRRGFDGPYSGLSGAIVVEDREWVDEDCTGDFVLVEETQDWFAQDDAGNVWYLGEDTTAWDDENNCLTKAGAWEAGKDGAEAGVVMLGSPFVGASYQQEFYEGEAEDRADVLRMNVPVSIEFGDYAGCMKTKEYTPLSPGEVEHKFYCPLTQGGLGLMLIHELAGKTKVVEYIGQDLPRSRTVVFPQSFKKTDDCAD